jgi:hypothetical protein
MHVPADADSTVFVGFLHDGRPFDAFEKAMLEALQMGVDHRVAATIRALALARKLHAASLAMEGRDVSLVVPVRIPSRSTRLLASSIRASETHRETTPVGRSPGQDARSWRARTAASARAGSRRFRMA